MNQGPHQGAAGDGRGPPRQADQEPEPHRGQLLAAQEEPDPDRDPPRVAQGRGHAADGADPDQQPHHWRHQGLQVQDALRLRPFPHQRQRREERRDRPVRGRDPELYRREDRPESRHAVRRRRRDLKGPKGRARPVRQLPRGRLPERRRHPADLQSPEQGHPEVPGRPVRLGEGQHCRGVISSPGARKIKN